MPDHDGYDKLAEILGFAGSARLTRILRMLMTEQEAWWLCHLPATPGQLAQRTNCPAAHARELMQSLVMKGFALPGESTPTGTMFSRMDIGLLADSVLSDAQYESLGQEFYDLWRDFYNQESMYERQARLEHETGPAGFRVLPAEGALPREGTFDYERVSWIVEQAQRIAVTHCPCRRRERGCDHEIDVCLSFDEVAAFAITRGARPLDHDETLALLERCSQNGLIHNVENTGQPRIICNCCPCCCSFLRPRVVYGLKLPIATSHYQVALDADLCVNCGLCLERCSFGALNPGQDHPMVQGENCIGCGLCVITCPEGALSLKAVGPETDLLPRGLLANMSI